MDCGKTGALIRRLRLEGGLTQKQLAEQLRISPKTVSKWEVGQGCPDVTLLPDLSAALGVGLDSLLTGNLEENSPVPGNMKHIKFYVCPTCGSITAATGTIQAACCGMTLSPLTAQKAAEADRLTVESVEDEWFLTGSHPMTKENHISFLAFATGDSVQILKQYPEWDLQARLPRRRHGTLFFFSTEKGLFYQYL